MKKISVVILALFLAFICVAPVLAGDLGNGESSDYPGAYDTNPDPQDGSENTTHKPGEGGINAVIAVQREMGINPAGSLGNVDARLDVEHDEDGTHSDITATSIDATVTKIGGYAVSANGAEISEVCEGAFSALTASWDPGSIAVGAMEAKVIVQIPIALGDYVLGSFSLDVQDLELNCQATDTSEITCVLSNNTAGAVDLGSGTLGYIVFAQ